MSQSNITPQLDDLISYLFNHVYAKSVRYRTTFFDVSSLKMERFKLSDYNLDDIFGKTRIQFAKKVPTGIRADATDPSTEVEEILFKREGTARFSMIHLVPYSNRETIHNMNDPVNAHLIIRTLLSELVVNDRASNILLPIINVDAEGTDLAGYSKVAQYIDNSKIYSIQVTEKFYKFTTLDDFLNNYPLDLRVMKSILYQAIDILYQISISYPGFRYNQFVPSKIDCYLKQYENVTIFPELKLGNFYLAEIEGIVENSYLEKVKIPRIQLPYADLYQLLNYLWNNYEIDINKYPELVTIFDTLLPVKIRSSESYLTLEKWNLLSDEEKNELKIKNIRNNTFFTSKDSLLGTSFVEPEDIPSRIQRNKKQSVTQMDQSITKEEESELHDPSIPIIRKKISDKEVPNKKSNNNDIDIMTNNKQLQKDKKMDNSSTENKVEKVTTEVSQHVTKTGKDYLSTSEKPQKIATKESVTEITETTDKNKYKSSRIYNISDYDYDKKTKRTKQKSKTYHGRRKINGGEDLSNLSRMVPMQNDYGSLDQSNMQQARISSIGNLLGATQNDLLKSPSVNYGQLMQQLTPQMMGPNGVPIHPGNIPPNVIGQIPSIPSPHSSPNVQYGFGQDGDTLMKYLAASNQLQGQNQIDQNTLNAMLMQQQMNNNITANPYSQMPMLPIQLPAQPTTQGASQPFPPSLGAQSGGSRRNPFFFQ